MPTGGSRGSDRPSGMKKIALLCLAALLPAALYGQSLRTNYRSGGIAHISTEYEAFRMDGVASEVRVEQVVFPDGSALYLLYLNLLQKTALNVPKGVKMAVNLNDGGLLRIEQIGQEPATKRRLDSGLFVNRFKYALERADMERMLRGVKSVDMITGWNPEDFLQFRFGADELAALLRRHCALIRDASGKTPELEATLAGYTENQNSVMSNAHPIVGHGERCDYNILLSHLYYKNTNREDVDLAFAIGSGESFHIPYDALVCFTLRDGSMISLQQTRDDVNFVYVYPELEQLFRMATAGVESLSIEYEGGTLEDHFPAEGEKNGFSDAVAQELQLLLSVSPR